MSKRYLTNVIKDESTWQNPSERFVAFFDIIISNIKEFHEFTQFHSDKHYLFRGEDSDDYELRPSFGGDMIISSANTPKIEIDYFEEFKRQGAQLISNNLINDWDLPALAQHHGLHTRLLDWTRSPLTAAYFSIRKKNIFDASIYINDSIIYSFEIQDLGEANLKTNPFLISSNLIFYPKHINARIERQNGVFTIHSKPDEIFNPPSMKRFTIKREFLVELGATLYGYHINDYSLFPDLNGLSSSLISKYIAPTQL